MILSAAATGAGAEADPAVFLTFVAALAATLVAVALYFYLPLVARLSRWYGHG